MWVIAGRRARGTVAAYNYLTVQNEVFENNRVHFPQQEASRLQNLILSMTEKASTTFPTPAMLVRQGDSADGTGSLSMSKVAEGLGFCLRRSWRCARQARALPQQPTCTNCVGVDGISARLQHLDTNSMSDVRNKSGSRARVSRVQRPGRPRSRQ